MRRLSSGLLLLLALSLSAQDMPLSMVLIPGEQWIPHVDRTFPADITSMVSDRSGTIYVALKDQKEIVKISLDGKVTSLAVSEPVHGLALDAEERLHATIPGSGKIVTFHKDHLIDTREGFPRGITQLAITKNGNFYLSIPEENRVILVPSAGNSSPDRQTLSVGGLKVPTGLQLWAKDETLVVGEAGGKHLMTYRVDRDGSLKDGDRYYALRVRLGQPAHTGGMTLDREQRLYAATAVGVQIFDPIGRLCGVIPAPRGTRPVALAWAGPKRDLLLLASGQQLFALKTRTSSLDSPPKTP